MPTLPATTQEPTTTTIKRVIETLITGSPTSIPLLKEVLITGLPTTIPLVTTPKRPTTTTLPRTAAITSTSAPTTTSTQTPLTTPITALIAPSSTPAPTIAPTTTPIPEQAPQVLNIAGLSAPLTFEALSSVSETQLEETLEDLADIEPSPEQAAAIIAIIEQSSPKVKAKFENKVNVYSGAYDDYRPVGQNTTVAERRALVAISGVFSSVGMAGLAGGSRRRN
jgi:ABC-type Fe3+-hydroxamate transport system substrate-binding protein